MPRADTGTAWPRARLETGAAERCIVAMADLVTAGRWTGRVDGVLLDSVRILDRIAWAAAGLPGTQAPVSTQPMHPRRAATRGAGPPANDPPRSTRPTVRPNARARRARPANRALNVPFSRSMYAVWIVPAPSSRFAQRSVPEARRRVTPMT